MGRAERRAAEKKASKKVDVDIAKRNLKVELAKQYNAIYDKGFRRGSASTYDIVTAAMMIAMRDVLGLGKQRMEAVRKKFLTNFEAICTKDVSGEWYTNPSDIKQTLGEELYHGKFKTDAELADELGLDLKFEEVNY